MGPCKERYPAGLPGPAKLWYLFSAGEESRAEITKSSKGDALRTSAHPTYTAAGEEFRPTGVKCNQNKLSRPVHLHSRQGSSRPEFFTRCHVASRIGKSYIITRRRNTKRSCVTQSKTSIFWRALSLLGGAPFFCQRPGPAKLRYLFSAGEASWAEIIKKLERRCASYLSTSYLCCSRRGIPPHWSKVQPE